MVWESLRKPLSTKAPALQDATGRETGLRGWEAPRMRRIVVNPSGDERGDLLRDRVFDFVLGMLGLLALFFLTAWVFLLLLGYPLLERINLLFFLLGGTTLVTMCRIYRDYALPGEGHCWMTKRTGVGTFFHCLIYSYILFLMGVAIDLPFFRIIPVWIWGLVVELP
jgi:hypothetical protein